MADWTGNNQTAFKIMGASTHSSRDRQNEDYYATDPEALKMLLDIETFSHKIWEPSCGEGHLSKPLIEAGFDVKSTDLVDRGFGEVLDFFQCDGTNDRDIITNPPYKYATEYTVHALNLLREGGKLALFLKLTFLEGKSRRIALFDKSPPIRVWVSSTRIHCGLNGEFAKERGSAVSYAWFIWEKGFTGKTTIGWFN